MTGSAVVDEGRLYMGVWTGYIYCLDADGKEVWRFRTGDRIGDQRPLIDGGFVYFGSNDKYLYCLNKNTGEFVWRFKTQGDIWCGSISIDDEVIFGGWDCYLYALNKYTGHETWRFQTSTKQQSKLEIFEQIIIKDEKIEPSLNIEAEAMSYSTEMTETLSGEYNTKSEYVTKSEYTQKSEYTLGVVIQDVTSLNWYIQKNVFVPVFGSNKF